MRFCLRAVLAAALCCLPIFSSAHAEDSTRHTVKMKTGEIDTSSRNLSVFSGGAPSKGSHFYIVQFTGPIDEPVKNRIKSLGVKFRGYLPEDSFIVKMSEATAAEVSADPGVTWVGPYMPEHKISPERAVRPETAPAVGKTYTVKVFDNEDLRTVKSELEALGAEVKVVADRKGLNGKILRVRMDESLVPEAAKIEEVEWVEEYTPPHLLNDVAVGIMNVSQEWSANTSLTGTGQVVGVMDTGLDTGNTSTIHPAFYGNVSNGSPKLKAEFSYGRTNDWSDPDGHGTHVSGSITGKTFMGISGAAYDAQLVMQSVLDSQGGLGGIGDIAAQLLAAYNDGVRIHSDSWGGGTHGAYDSFTQSIDGFIWSHPDFLAFFAAGNDGVDANKDGVIDTGSVTPPATGKNIVSIGATENYRPNLNGFYDKWGPSWPKYFPVNPIYNDLIADNKNGMAAFSSRGPTSDGRVKPDLAAPGAYILSTKSTVPNLTGGYWANASYDSVYNSSYDPYFAFDGGTSMATPLAAGAAALVRQYYTDVAKVTPSAALIKATLISGAANMAPGQYGTFGSATQEIKNPPDNSQGWGRVDVADSIAPPAPHNVLYADEPAGVATSGKLSYFYEVADTTVPVKVTLVWTDYPGTPSAAKMLVNDLDLVVTGPDGTVYHGNQFDTGGYSTANASGYDRINNVEVVNINPSALTVGTVEIDVNGYTVPDGIQGGTQPFAVVIDGGVNPITCDFSLSPSAPSGTMTFGGGSGSFDVSCNGACSWSAKSDSPTWLAVTGGTRGPGTVNYTVASNYPNLSSRTGNVTAGGKTFTITQDATPVNFSMNMKQEGSAVTLTATYTLGNNAMVKKPVTFYDFPPGGTGYVKKGTVYTNSSGIATLKFTASAGAHAAYAYTPAAGSYAAQSTQTVPGPIDYAIEKPTLSSPSNGQVVSSSPVTLSWGLLPDATDYEVQVYSSSTFPATLQNYSVTANSFTTYSSYTMLPGTARYWRVRGVVPNGHTLYSATSKFIYKPVPTLEISVTQNIPKAQVTLTATVRDPNKSGALVSGRKIYFYDNSVSKGYATTGTYGTAMKTISGVSGTTHIYQITFKGDSKYAGPVSASTQVTLQ